MPALNWRHAVFAGVMPFVAIGTPASSRPLASDSVKTSLPPDSNPRDLQGIWQSLPSNRAQAAGYEDPTKAGSGPGGPPPGFGVANIDALPMKPEAAARARRELDFVMKGSPLMTWRVACRPSTPQALLGDDIGGYEIIQTPTQVLFLFETDNTYWRVDLDRDHPASLKPSYLGDSVGHWDGNVLIIDTIGYNGRGSLSQGTGPNGQLHTVTRVWKTSGTELKFQTSFEDPANLTGPASLPEGTARLAPDHLIYEEHCTQGASPENYEGMIFEEFTREEAFPYLSSK
ncbi:hypothetical protein [Novosphingobium sp. Rr 2-17]|uniref:hypothetical protein n=1 Tax=Novosphingobium sp. Rr 2-17 TaxID=555793 RepID=UPI0012F6899F|nr:hypothetical protein [Novosphingobium sp. Rr 2-17]